MPAAELRPLSLGEILDVAIKIYWRNAAVLLGLVVLVVAPVQLFVSIIYVSAIPDHDQSLFAEPSPAPADFDAHDLWVGIAAFLIGIVLTFVATTIATAGCFKAVADAYLGERAAWRSSLAFALRRVHGQTIGKKLLSIRVIDFNSRGSIGYLRAFGRYLGRFLSSVVLLLGYLWMLWDKEKQTWHDKLVSRVVVPTDAYPVSSWPN
jgi:uncharacterized RDD family membrane protein YckC